MNTSRRKHISKEEWDKVPPEFSTLINNWADEIASLRRANATLLEAAKKESDHIDMILDNWAWAIHPSELSYRLRNIKKALGAAIAAAETSERG